MPIALERERPSERRRQMAGTAGEERPEWLPEGWKMEVKAGEDGVIEKVVSRAEDSNEWLPTGWIVEIKTRKSGARAGEKYKCYLDPVTGSRFNSKKEVFRYVSARIPASDEKGCLGVNYHKNVWTSSNQNTSMDVNISKNVQTQIEYSPKGLPQGWIKEIRFRKSCASGHQDKKDQYYIEPGTGYIFRSLKDVSRYIENGEVGKQVSRLNERLISDMYCMETESPLCVASQEPKTRETTARRCLFSKEIKKTNARMEIQIGCSPEKLQMVPVSQISGLEGSGSSCPHPVKLDYQEGKNVKETKMDNKLYPALDEEGIQGEVWESGNEMLVGPVSDKQSEELNENIQNNKCSHAEDIKEKSSPSKENQPAMDVQKQNTVRSRGRPRKGHGGSQPESSQPKVVRQRKAKPVKAIIMPRRASKRLAGIKAASIAITNFSDPTSRAGRRWSNKLKATPAKDSNLSDESNATHEIIDLELPEEEVEVTEKHLEEKIALENSKEATPGSSVKLPFGDSWPDPCIEFAFKTLTGDIPPVEDSGAILNYFRQNFTSAQSPSRSVYLQ